MPDALFWGATLRKFALLFATLAFSGTAVAADLPMVTKAPSATPDYSPRYWLEADFLGWTVTGDKLPALVTTSPAGTPAALAGVLGAPGTTVLFGDSAANNDWRAGGRLTGGYWFDPSHRTGIEASFFDLANASSRFNANSGGTPILAQPFTNAVTGKQDALFSAFPGFDSGAVSANDTSRLLGASIIFRQDIGWWGSERFSALIGYRYLRSSDGLGVSSSIVSGPGVLAVPLGTTIGVSDSFNAASNFNGIDLGAIGEFKTGPWVLEWRASIAIGANFSNAQINGSTNINGATAPGGFLALSSNIGNYNQTTFAVVPELNLKVGYQLTPHWRVVAGYDVLYWTGVLRSGNLIDTTINPNLLPPPSGGGPQRPQASLNTSSLIAQGFNVGLRSDF